MVDKRIPAGTGLQNPDPKSKASEQGRAEEETLREKIEDEGEGLPGQDKPKTGP
jgi:hypothetical protein